MINIEVVNLDGKTGKRREVFELDWECEHFVEFVEVLHTSEQLWFEHLIELDQTDFYVNLEAEVFQRVLQRHNICCTSSGLKSQHFFGYALKFV
jgi:hypothetical protein